MADRLRILLTFAVVLAVGAFLGSAWVQWGSSDGPDEVEPGLSAGSAERIRIEVLNGGGKADMARLATGRLRDHGLDVVYWGNASTFGRDSSVVLDRVGRLEAAREVAEVLGIPMVRSEPDSSLYLDVTVLLGQDWEPGGAPRDSTSRAPWWDLRRLFR